MSAMSGTGVAKNLAGLKKIGQLAALAGVSADTLRYYERLGLLPAPHRTHGGYRLYDGSTSERIDFIRRGQALGLTLEEIRDHR